MSHNEKLYYTLLAFEASTMDSHSSSSVILSSLGPRKLLELIRVLKSDETPELLELIRTLETPELLELIRTLELLSSLSPRKPRVVSEAPGAPKKSQKPEGDYPDYPEPRQLFL